MSALKTPPLHTPGPWTVVHRGGGIREIVSRNHDLASCWPASADADRVAENDANVALMTAAPDYYAAVEHLLEDSSELAGDDAGYVAIPKRAYDALIVAHGKAAGRS